MTPSKKALNLFEIAQTTRFNEPLEPDHEFYTDFSGLRGEFEESTVYKLLGTIKQNGHCVLPTINLSNKTILFLGGMRGSGKTSELAKYAKRLHHSDCFFCITCNIDQELDLNELEYMDILVLQLEKLIQKLSEEGITQVDQGILDTFQKWFEAREEEIKDSEKQESSIASEMSAGIDSVFLPFLKLVSKIKIGVTGSHERSEKVRKVLKNNFVRFADLFNQFIEEANIALRKQDEAREILFIVDGLEKTMSAETRRKIIVEEQNRIEKIKAFTIFTLPIELMAVRENLSRFAQVAVFPFIKLTDSQGIKIEAAFDKFKEFILKRADISLFENETVIDNLITYSGGSPRQLLMLLQNTYAHAGDDESKITNVVLDKVLDKMANAKAATLTAEMIEKLKEIKRDSISEKITPYDTIMQNLLEDEYVMEYNSGTLKRVNPLLELSKLYIQDVAS